jgi:hypothetical protein
MALDQTVASADSTPLTIRKIGISDLRDVLAKGYDDFTAMHWLARLRLSDSMS